MKDWHLPFEEQPITPMIDDPIVCSGVVVMAAKVEVEGQLCPAIVFRFELPEGPLLRPVMVVHEREQMPRLATLVQDAVDTAVRHTG